MTEPSRNLVVLFCDDDDDDGWGTQLITFGPSVSHDPGETEQRPGPASEKPCP